VIVVIGSPLARLVEGGPATAAGLAARIAVTAAGAGAAVQLVGKVGEDPAGEEVLLDLARRGVRHVAVLRDPVRLTPLASGDDAIDAEAIHADDTAGGRSEVSDMSTLDAADVQLALSYLPEYATIVVAEPIAADGLRVVVDAARWAGAAIVLVGEPAEGTDLPENATVFAAPADGDPDEAFAAMVGAYAAALDRGDDPKAAFAAASAAVGSSAID
jgi:sugar/nucleoside kinase (ribokinase family)